MNWWRSAGCGYYSVAEEEELGDELEADASGGADYEPDLGH